MGANNANDNERSALQILQEINSGLTDPKLLDKQCRQQCVELLIAEGYTYPQIGQVLKVSERTVIRDVKDIRARNEMVPNIEFAKQFVGEVFNKAMNHHSFLVRLSRAKDTAAAEKIQAEFAGWKILKELVEKLQTLGYLPLKPQEIAGELYHHIAVEEAGESVLEARRMLSEIESVAIDTGTYTPELAEEVKALSGRLEKAEVINETKKLAEKQKKEIEHKENKNEE
jgi:transposase